MTYETAKGVEWIYPNVSELNRGGCRGGLSERHELANRNGFDLVEMPGDFVKNGSECARLGCDLGAPLLAREALQELYVAGPSVPSVRYSLHTEPSVPRSARGFRPTHAELAWHRIEWLEQFLTHVTGIVEFLGVQPEIVEVHPGYLPNSPRTVAQAVGRIVDHWRTQYGRCPQFLLENRTGQVISRGTHLAEYWKETTGLGQDFLPFMGIVLDVQQLHTEARSEFKSDLGLLPPEAVKAYHVHFKHTVPSEDDPIEWTAAFDLIRRSSESGHLYLLPEVHHHTAVLPTVQFVLERLPGLGLP